MLEKRLLSLDSEITVAGQRLFAFLLIRLIALGCYCAVTRNAGIISIPLLVQKVTAFHIVWLVFIAEKELELILEYHTNTTRGK